MQPTRLLSSAETIHISISACLQDKGWAYANLPHLAASAAVVACCWPSAAVLASSAHSGSVGSSRADKSANEMWDSTCSCLKASLMDERLMPSAACTANTAGCHVTWKGHSAGRSEGSCQQVSAGQDLSYFCCWTVL